MVKTWELGSVQYCFLKGNWSEYNLTRFKIKEKVSTIYLPSFRQQLDVLTANYNYLMSHVPLYQLSWGMSVGIPGIIK